MEKVKVGDIEFFTCETYPLESIKRCQQKSKDMTEIIINIFDRNGIEYILAHGTLLGMVRHNGHFIPWDDDCDLFVFDWCYAKAIEILRRELPGDMIVHNRRTDPIYWCKWTKIRDIHSDTYESLWAIDRKLKYHGICIDLLRVTPQDGGQNRLRKLNKKIAARKKDFKAELKGCKDKKKRFSISTKYKFGNIGYSLLLTLYRIISLFDHRQLLIANMDTVIEGSFKKKDVFPLKKYTFEGMEVSGPKNPDGVLKALYGNYMQLPPLEKRQPHFSEIKFLD